MRPCVSLSLPFLGHTAVARFSPPEELIPIYRAPAVGGQVLYSPPPGGNSALQAGTRSFYMSQELHREVWLPILSFPPHFRSSTRHTSFPMTPVLTGSKLFLAFFPQEFSLEISLSLYPTVILIPGTIFSQAFLSKSRLSLKLSFPCTPNPRPYPFNN